MIFESTGADELLLADALKCRVEDKSVHPKNYRDCAILKPWGYEFEMFDDRKNAVWLLNMNPNRSTSMHCHQHKAAVLIPLTGEITLITLSGRYIIKPMESATLMPKTFHCLWNSGSSEVAVIEIESPSIKLDLVRANDAYGREKSGYEGSKFIVRENLDQYGYGRINGSETITRFGYDISIDQNGIKIRKPVDA